MRYLQQREMKAATHSRHGTAIALLYVRQPRRVSWRQQWDSSNKGILPSRARSSRSRCSPASVTSKAARTNSARVADKWATRTNARASRSNKAASRDNKVSKDNKASRANSKRTGSSKARLSRTISHGGGWTSLRFP